MKVNMENFDELIEKSKELSKKKFLEFAKGIYGVDEEIFDHLWKVPIIPKYKSDTLIKTTLSTKDEDEIIEILDEEIDSQLGSSEAVFIPFEYLSIYFEENERDEYINKLNNKEFDEDYNAVIIYNEPVLKQVFKRGIENNSKKENPLNQEEINSKFIEYVSKIFTHERCHLNASCLVKGPNGEVLLNGAQEEAPDGAGSYTLLKIDNLKKQNEVLLDTLRDMMHLYEPGDKLEDCIYKAIKVDNVYDEIKDDIVNTVKYCYVLFPEEITKWAMFGAYREDRVNILKEKDNEIFGEKNLVFNLLNKKVREYCSKVGINSLSDKQIEMLKTLGVGDIEKQRKINNEDIKKVAMSVDAMQELEFSSSDIESAIKSNEENRSKRN